MHQENNGGDLEQNSKWFQTPGSSFLTVVKWQSKVKDLQINLWTGRDLSSIQHGS